MKHQNTAGNINTKPITDPLARIRDEDATLPSAFVVNNQGGCVRAWLISNLGFVLIGVGWLFSCLPLAVPDAIEYGTAFIIASWFFGLGVGWLVYCEGGGR